MNSPLMLLTLVVMFLVLPLQVQLLLGCHFAGHLAAGVLLLELLP